MSKEFSYAAEAEQEITIEELEFLEAKYTEENNSCQSVSADTQFLYSWGLIRSRYAKDKELGINLLSETMKKWPSRTRDCLYYLAIGHYRLGNYKYAAECADDLLSIEPKNLQALSLKKLIESKLQRDGILGLAVLGGIVAAAAGVAYAMIRSKTEK